MNLGRRTRNSTKNAKRSVAGSATIAHRTITHSNTVHRSVVTPAYLLKMAELPSTPKIVLNKFSTKDIEHVNNELEKKGLIKRMQLENLTGNIHSLYLFIRLLLILNVFFQFFS